ncbi:MAG: hypothetical protein H7263_13735 [Candidatus Sericytochromatia bacterium]|nr:hypothetical protein [Candidatus Sericytochromatia bacterium]
MNLKKISVSLITLVSCSLTACSNNQILQPTIDQGNVNISSKELSAQDIMNQASMAYSKLNDFTATVAVTDAKDGNQSTANIGESKFFFKKERNERVETTKGNDAQKVGSILVYKGGSKVDILLAKPIFILGRRFTLDVGDKKIATSRGLAFNQLDLTSMLARFNKSGAVLSILPTSTLRGRNIIKISGKGTFKDIDSGITEEILSLDSETMLPVQDESFVQSKSVLKINVSDLKINVGLKDDVFVLPDSK